MQTDNKYYLNANLANIKTALDLQVLNAADQCQIYEDSHKITVTLYELCKVWQV